MPDFITKGPWFKPCMGLYIFFFIWANIQQEVPCTRICTYDIPANNFVLFLFFKRIFIICKTSCSYLWSRYIINKLQENTLHAAASCTPMVFIYRGQCGQCMETKHLMNSYRMTINQLGQKFTSSSISYRNTDAGSRSIYLYNSARLSLNITIEILNGSYHRL